jgi:hypothetical protein
MRIRALFDLPALLTLMAQGMNEPFRSFGLGLVLSLILLYLILIAQFRSFVDPFLIMLAIPISFIGVLVIPPLTHTTLNVMSLMGVLMLVGIADSNSILIVDFAHKLVLRGGPLQIRNHDRFWRTFMRHFSVTLLLVLSTAGRVLAQPGAPVKLNLHDAEALALKNHPQVLAAQHAVSSSTASRRPSINWRTSPFHPALRRMRKT